MAKNKKPKFLEAETPDLLALLKETLSDDEVDEKAIAKALKITEELISRQPGDEEAPSVDEALKSAAEVMTDALNKIKGAYENEISMMEDSEDPVTEEDDEEEEETPKAKKAKKEKTSKKSKKKPEPEEDDDEDSDDEDSDDEESEDEGEDYSDWSLKDLKKECRTRGIKVTKGTAKADMVKALEADDKE